MESVVVTDVNQATLQLFGAGSKEELKKTINNFIPVENINQFIQELVYMWDGKEKFEIEVRNKTLDGRVLDLISNWAIVPGYKKDLSKVIISKVDITGRKQAEAQIHLQATALEAAANAIVITDKDGSIEWINPAYTQLTGYTSGDVLNQNPRILRSGFQDEIFIRTYGITILSGQVWRSELVNKRKDGSLYTEEETITPLVDIGGKITHFIGIKQDITERKRAEEALRESEERFKKLFAEAPMGIALIDSLSGKFINVNPHVCQDFRETDCRDSHNSLDGYHPPG